MTLCSQLWGADGLSAYGTAPAARFWVALEQNGPWGRDALTQSHLDPELGRALVAACERHGGRPLLIRNPGPHADKRLRGVRRVFVSSAVGTPWLVTGVIADPGQLLELPFDRLDGGPDAVLAAAPWLHRTDLPVLLVCANGKRDACCALRGRELATALAATHPRQVWECSHTGGHRFAPTGVLLPFGRALARLTLGLAAEVLAAAQRGELAASVLGPRHDRGLSHLAAPEAVAESVLRQHLGDVGVPPQPAPVGTRVVVERSERPPLPESCGKGPVPVHVWAGRVEVDHDAG